jgi:hypothetical protein
MLQLSVRQRTQTQLPAREGLVKAWISFFVYKSQNKEAVNNVQAWHALRTYKHLRDTEQDGDRKLSGRELRQALTVLAIMPKDDTTPHVELARLLYADCQSPRYQLNNLRRFIEVLTRTGNSLEARELVVSHISQQVFSTEEASSRDASTEARIRGLWYQLLDGFAREGNEAELLKTWEITERAGSEYDSTHRDIIASFYASRNGIAATKQWYEKLKQVGPLQEVDGRTLKKILTFSIRNNELDWCKSIFRDILATEPPKIIWDVVLQWGAGALGKGVEDVEKMMEVMILRNPENQELRPDAETINGLVELAMSLNDSYLAERYITLGSKFGIRPNAKTYALQMSYRAEANDLRGAQAAYDLLQAEEVIDNEDLPAINKYIRALCTSAPLNYDRLVSILSDLSERGKRLEADTTCALTSLYLSRDQTDDLIDLIQSEAYYYTYEERASIQKVFMDFCLSSETNTNRSWIAYTLLHPLFDETSVGDRTRLMNHFFSRGRCDMASYVFGHMRAHAMPDRRPVLDTYIECFLGIASCADREALDMVHNMLKLDSNIDPTTRLYNSLMLAYTACEDADKALDFWDDITNSGEGPTYQSLEIVFWACSRKPFGDVRAREVWGKMRRMEIEVTGKVFSAFVGALAGQGKLDEAKGVCEQVPKELGLSVDVLT